MRNKGFTLIELLVVIAIIGLLLSILLPGLRSAKQQAQSVYCMNNLKQMYTAAITYTVEQNEYFPISRYTEAVSASAASAGGSSSVCNMNLSSSGMTVYSREWDFTTVQEGDNVRVEAGILWQGDAIDLVQQCPSYKGSSNTKVDTFCGYNYNTSFIGHGQNERWDSRNYRGQVQFIPDPVFPDYKVPLMMPVKHPNVRRAGRCALFGDGHYYNGANKYMRSPLTWAGDMDRSLRPAGTQGYRHRGKTNVVWCDGRVQTYEERYTQCDPRNTEIDDFDEDRNVKVGFLSADNSAYKHN